jgi:hypothetical protein
LEGGRRKVERKEGEERKEGGDTDMGSHLSFPSKPYQTNERVQASLEDFKREIKRKRTENRERSQNEM